MVGTVKGKYALILLFGDTDVNTTLSRDQLSWLCLYFYKSCNNRTWLDDWPMCTVFTLHVMITLAQLGPPYVSLLTTITGRIVDQHVLLLASLRGKYLWLLFSLSLPNVIVLSQVNEYTLTINLFY